MSSVELPRLLFFTPAPTELLELLDLGSCEGQVLLWTLHGTNVDSLVERNQAHLLVVLLDDADSVKNGSGAFLSRGARLVVFG